MAELRMINELVRTDKLDRFTRIIKHQQSLMRVWTITTAEVGGTVWTKVILASTETLVDRRYHQALAVVHTAKMVVENDL